MKLVMTSSLRMITAVICGLAGTQCLSSAGQIEIRSGAAVLVVDEATGAIMRLADERKGTEFCSGGEGLFKIAIAQGTGSSNAPTELASKDAKTVKRIEGPGVLLRFDQIGGGDMAAICSIASATNGYFRFNIEIQGGSGKTIERIDYPQLSLKAPLGGDGADDAVVFGTTKGGILKRPHLWKQGRQLSATQPGNLAAQFGCYYGESGGVMTHCEDSAGHPKTLLAIRTQNGLTLGWRHPMRQNLNRGFKMAFPVVLGLFGGQDGARPDWRDAATAYKSWAVKQPWCAKTFAARDDLPEWLRQGPAQVRFGRDWLSQPERIEAWLDQYWLKYYRGVPLIVTFWGWEGVATWVPPQYFPPHPSEEGLRRCIEAVRRAGGHAFFWPSGYQWCLTYGKRDDGSFEWEDRARFEREAKPHAMIGKDGKVMLTNPPWYRGGEAATLCRGDKWSRDWLSGVAVELARLGGELFQIDQVVGAGMRGGGDCRSTAHGHPPGIGKWDIEAAHSQMAEMSAACRAAGVNMVLGFEEPQERFLQEVGIQDYRDYEVATRSPHADHRAESVFGFLYHEFVPIFQSNPNASNREMTAHCIVTGQMPHLVPQWPVGPHAFPINGGFEEWSDDVPIAWERVEGWKGAKFLGRPHRDESIRHGGKNSLRIEASDEATQVSRNLPIGPGGLLPGAKYRISAWLKVGRLDKAAAINIAALGGELKSAGSWKLPFPAPGDWKQASVDVVIPAKGADMLRIMIHVGGPCQVWVDDFAVAELGADGVARPLVRDGLPSQHDLYRQWISLYHGEGRSYLQCGQAVPPPSLESDSPISVGSFRADNGSIATVAVNRSDEPQTVKLSLAGQMRSVAFGPWDVKLLLH